LGIVGFLYVPTPEATLRGIAALGLAAAALALWAPGRALRFSAIGLGAAAVLVVLWLPPGWTALRPHFSEYKGLTMALSAPDARIVAERSSPLGIVDVVESPTIPFRHAPGLSLNNVIEPITDFSAGDDTIRLENAFMPGLATGTLAASAFRVGTTAFDASARIVYNDDTGALFFDQDGTGAVAKVQFATLDAGLAMSNLDFLIV
jgi:hypothetical protein